MTPAELCKEIYGVEPERIVNTNTSPTTSTLTIRDSRAHSVYLAYRKVWHGSTCYALNCALVNGVFFHTQIIEVTT